jgi:anti-sigma regulatory factor (Ser/Thr protein kinase)
MLDRGEPTSRGVELWADASAPSRARDLFEDVAGSLPGDIVSRGELLISEAVTNSVRYGSPRSEDSIEVSVDIDPGRVHVEVSDHSVLRRPLHTPESTRAGGGLGLLLIDRLSDRWGVTPRPEGKAVWFELDLPLDELHHLVHDPRAREEASMLGKRARVKNQDQPAQKKAAGRNGGRASARKRS